MKEKEVRILMCCSDLSVKGGMVSVVKNYLSHKNWEEFEIRYVPTHIEQNKLAVALYFAIAYVKIVLLALFKKIDIAYLHVAERGSFYRKALIVRTLRCFGVKTVLHHHGAEFEEFYNGLSLKGKRYVCDILEMVDLNIVLSERLVSMIINKAKNANVKVLYNAVKTYKKNQYNSDGKFIMFLGRLGERKGVYDLLEVIKRINSKIGPDIKFLLCGDGDVDAVKEKIKEFGIEHRISHVGWIDNDMKNKFMPEVIINVLPSYNEGLPMTILETMAYGIPNISTNVASIPEVVFDRKNGVLIEPGDTDALESAIIELLEEKCLREEFSKNAWDLITQKFSLDSNLECLKQYLRDIY